MRKSQQSLQDTNVRLLDVIKEQHKTIDKLTDKLMARNLQEYRAEDTPTDPANRMKEDPTVHFMDAPGEEILKAQDEE